MAKITFKHKENTETSGVLTLKENRHFLKSKLYKKLFWTANTLLIIETIYLIVKLVR